MRLGIYGGSFDPIHLGHLWVAETARELLRLDRVLFVPAALSPLKQDRRPIEDRHRLEMMRLALSGVEYFGLDERELHRGGVSYTIDTLRELRDELLDTELYLIMGSDSLADFGRWREPEAICQIATLSIVQRGGDPPVDWNVLRRFCNEEMLKTIQASAIHTALIELSSSDLRARVASGKSIRFRVPRAVEVYIQQKLLYRLPQSS